MQRRYFLWKTKFYRQSEQEEVFVRSAGNRKAVPEELLDAVLEAGTYAPTGGGRQSPVIVAVKDAAYREEIARLNAEVMGKDIDPYYGAPIVIIVLADGKANTFVEDGSCVLENMMIAAHALGLGSVWVHREREMIAAHALGLGSVWVHREREIFDGENGKTLLRKWGLPETLRGVGAIALGYPATDLPKATARKADYIIKI